MEAENRTDDAASAVRAMVEPWSRACLERDWDALLEMCNEDIVFMPPGGEAVSGPDVRPWLEEFPEIKAMSWSVGDVVQEGDVAWLRGPVKQTLEIEGEDEHFDGKYADVIRRGPDGKWRFSLIIWNANEH